MVGRRTDRRALGVNLNKKEGKTARENEKGVNEKGERNTWNRLVRLELGCGV